MSMKAEITDYSKDDSIATRIVIMHNGKKLHSFSSDYSVEKMEKIGKLIEDAYKGKAKELTKNELFGNTPIKPTQKYDLQHFNDCIMTAEKDGIKDRAK